MGGVFAGMESSERGWRAWRGLFVGEGEWCWGGEFSWSL